MRFRSARAASLSLTLALGVLAGALALSPAASGAGAAPNVPAGLGVPRQVSPPGMAAQHPRFSPDGRSIVFQATSRGEEAAPDLYVMDAEGTHLRRLTDDPANDRDPTWAPAGDHIVFASDRDGDFDLYRVAVDGSDLHQLTNLEGDEIEPSVSPLQYVFSGVVEDQCSSSGVSGEELDRYGKVAFTRRWHRKDEVWFASLNGRHQGRVSPAKESCRAPAWSGDGLSLAFECGAGPRARTRVLDAEARWDQSFEAAVRSLGKAKRRRCASDELLESWDSDACSRGLPRHYARHVPRPSPVARESLAAPTYSANQILLVATRSGATPALVHRQRSPGAPWQPLAVATPGPVREAVWAPDGRSVAVVAEADGQPAVFLAPSDLYLQEVRNLWDFPELWSKGPSDRLRRNHFVARPGRDKEFFAAYERLRYQRRPAFVSTDAALQVMHDEFARVLAQGEVRAAERLRGLCTVLAADYERRFAAEGAPVLRYLAVLFAVPQVLLTAGSKIDLDPASEDSPFPEPGTPPPPPAGAQLAAALAEALAAVPASLRAEVGAHLKRLRAHAGVERLSVPGLARPLPIDWTLFRPRGAYAGTQRLGWFLAMTWFASVPLPLDPEALALQPRMATLRLPGGPAEPSLAEVWRDIDRLVAAFMGQPADLTLSHLDALRGLAGAVLQPLDPARATEALRRNPAAPRFRGLQGALEPTLPRQTVLLFFPRRAGLDVEWFRQLTGPDVDGRAVPAALDVLAVLGNDRARDHALSAAQGESWAAAYQERLTELARTVGGPGAGYGAADLYHAWLALVATLANPPALPPDSRLAFARSEAWADRLLSSALAGYAKLKHQALLYSLTEYGAECDSERPLLLFVEQPVLPLPRGFVDPHPEFFAGLAALAERLHRDLGDGSSDPVTDELPLGEDAAPESVELDAARFARTLEGMARKELAGTALSEHDHRWLLHAGAMIEALFLDRFRHDDQQALGIDEGRSAAGVSLVADIFNDVFRLRAIELGVGRLLDLYVAVPDTLGQRMTQGSVFSVYEFAAPMAQRPDDATWSQRLDAGQAPPPPAWTTSFLEPAP